MVDEMVDETEDRIKVPIDEMKSLFDLILKKITEGRVSSFNDIISTVLERGYDSSVAADIIQFLSKKIAALVAGV